MPKTVKVKIEQNIEMHSLPAIALRGLVVFPKNVIHFEVGRKKSIAAIEWAMEHNTQVFLVAQRNVEEENPLQGDLYTYGVVADVKQLLRVSDNVVKVLVEGKYRAKIHSLNAEKDFLIADISEAKLRMPGAASAVKAEALARQIKEAFTDYIELNSRMPKDVIYTVMSCEDTRFLSEFIPTNVMFKYQDKQRVLDQNSLIKRLEVLLEIFVHENNVLELEQEIQDKTSEQLDKTQRDYYLREQMNTIAEELGDYEDTRTEAQDYKERITALKLEADTEEKLLKEADRLSRMQGSSQEGAVIRTYLDTCLELPWNISTKEQINIKKAKSILNREHYGLEKVKDRILELLAVRQFSGNTKGQIICLVGPPGVGKTSIAKSVAECMNRKYARLSLGGVKDESEIRGHRRTYIGAMPGKIMSTMVTAKSKNPLMLLDEIDKISHDFKGDPDAALLEALDPEQNATFRDHYLDIPFDLSEVLFITTANSLDTISRPLLDRMDVIEISSYTRNEKFQIAKRHLIPKQIKKTGLDGKVKFTSSAIYGIIDGYTSEAGVRNLERTIAELLRKCARRIAEGESESFTLDNDSLEKMLGPKRRKPTFFNRTNAVGMANGLAWTSVGGELLPIEVIVTKQGKGNLELTGSLGDIMKESAKLALTYAKAHADEYGIDAAALEKCDIHIHAPEGAVPKDGPSAGVTLTTALISALSGIPVRSDVAMTGEITLHGAVLPIGGLKEKSMAAYREGMKTVLIPKDNVSDLYDVDETVKQKINFVPVTSLQEVLNINLIRNKKKNKAHKVITAPQITASNINAGIQ